MQAYGVVTIGELSPTARRMLRSMRRTSPRKVPVTMSAMSPSRRGFMKAIPAAAAASVTRTLVDAEPADAVPKDALACAEQLIGVRFTDERGRGPIAERPKLA